jgi:hypothetical protein
MSSRGIPCRRLSACSGCCLRGHRFATSQPNPARSPRPIWAVDFGVLLRVASRKLLEGRRYPPAALSRFRTDEGLSIHPDHLPSSEMRFGAERQLVEETTVRGISTRPSATYRSNPLLVDFETQVEHVANGLNAAGVLDTASDAAAVIHSRVGHLLVMLNHRDRRGFLRAVGDQILDRRVRRLVRRVSEADLRRAWAAAMTRSRPGHIPPSVWREATVRWRPLRAANAAALRRLEHRCTFGGVKQRPRGSRPPRRRRATVGCSTSSTDPPPLDPDRCSRAGCAPPRRFGSGCTSGRARSGAKL